jgi:hypothetical protein
VIHGRVDRAAESAGEDPSFLAPQVGCVRSFERLLLAMSFDLMHQRRRHADRASAGAGLHVRGDHSPAVPLRAVRAVPSAARFGVRAAVLPDELLDRASDGHRGGLHLTVRAELRACSAALQSEGFAAPHVLTTKKRA